METSHRLWDFPFSHREFVSPDDTASPIFASRFVNWLSAFMDLICFMCNLFCHLETVFETVFLKKLAQLFLFCFAVVVLFLFLFF